KSRLERIQLPIKLAPPPESGANARDSARWPHDTEFAAALVGLQWQPTQYVSIYIGVMFRRGVSVSLNCSQGISEDHLQSATAFACGEDPKSDQALGIPLRAFDRLHGHSQSLVGPMSCRSHS